MSNELIFYTQIASTIAFIVSVFFLYRLLVSQKDATIESLRERLLLHKEKSAATSADELAEALGNRVNLVTEELTRLRSDNDL